MSCTQDDVGKEILPSLWTTLGRQVCDHLCVRADRHGQDDDDVQVPESLSSESVHEGQGAATEAVHATLQHNAERARRGVHSVLLLSAVEFYAFMAYDLADKAGKQMCTMNGHQEVGNTYTQ